MAGVLAPPVNFGVRYVPKAAVLLIANAMNASVVLVLSLLITAPPEQVDPDNSELIEREVRKAVAEQLGVGVDRIEAHTTFGKLGTKHLDDWGVAEKLGSVFNIPYSGYDNWTNMTVKDVARDVCDELAEMAIKSAGRKILEHHLSNPELEPMTAEELTKAAFLTDIERKIVKREHVKRYTFEPTRRKDYMFRFFFEHRAFSYDIYRTPHKPVDRSIEDAKAKSTDLAADKKLMWTTSQLEKREVHSSTREAIWAASRVFNTVSLVGRTREEIIELLGNPKTSNNSVYNFPFFPVAEGTLVYRFDTGAYGWQFNVEFNEKGKAQRVTRRWIH